MNCLHPQSRKFLPLTVLILLGAMVSMYRQSNVQAYPLKDVDSKIDRLVYTVLTPDGKRSLRLFDPRKGASVLLHPDVAFMTFSLSTDGRLAFPLKRGDHAEIYVLDTQASNSTPISISQNMIANAFPLVWSIDGRYLAFESYVDDKDKKIYVWDGKTIINITPQNLNARAESYSATWSADGRLAFTVWLNSDTGDPSEIYLWDGKTTTSLSQNSTGRDEEPTWSNDGRLAFLSARNGHYDIFVWDGISIKDGSPNVDTFINVAPELTAYYSHPTWTNKGLLAFEAQGPEDRHIQVYLWDGRTAINISQNPALHNGGQTWSADGRWAFVTFFSPEQLIYVRSADNSPILTVEGQYRPAWSSSGYLTFCTATSGGWTLSLWDGKQIVKIAQGWEIWAQWQSGTGNVCSSG